MLWPFAGRDAGAPVNETKDPAQEPLDFESTRSLTVGLMSETTTEDPIACSLDAAGAAQQLASWADLRPMLVRAEKTRDGARLWFDAAAAVSVSEVARKEAECCSFLAFNVEDEASTVRLDITSEHPDGVGVAQLLADEVGHERPSCC